MNSAAEKGTPNNHSVAAQFPSFYAPPGMLDSDTPLQPQSLEAAKRFCGCVVSLIIYLIFHCTLCYVFPSLWTVSPFVVHIQFCNSSSCLRTVLFISAFSAAILAVDHVMSSTCNVSSTPSGEDTNNIQEGEDCSRAFVIGRPPGHHAGPHGYAMSSFSCLVFIYSVFISMHK